MPGNAALWILDLCDQVSDFIKRTDMLGVSPERQLHPQSGEKA